jgi:hypothetical protein
MGGWETWNANPARNFPQPEDFLSNIMRLHTMRQQGKLADLQLEEQQRHMAEANAMRQAQAAAGNAQGQATAPMSTISALANPQSAPGLIGVAPGQTSSVQIPIGGQSVQGPPGTANPQQQSAAMIASLKGGPAAYKIPGIQADQQQAQQAQQAAQQTAAFQHTKESLQLAGTITEQLRQLSVPIALAESQGAPPEQIAALYQQQKQAAAPLIAQAKQAGLNIPSLPDQYVPGLGKQALQMGMSAQQAIQQMQHQAELDAKPAPLEKGMQWDPKTKRYDIPLKPNVSLPGGGASGSNLVDQIGTGKLAIDRVAQLVSKNPKLIDDVIAKYPDFDSSKIKAYAKAYQEFTTGPESDQITGGAVALQHLKRLKDINDANPTEVRIPGTKAYQEFHNLLDTVTDELVTFYGEPKTNEVIKSKKDSLGALVNRDAAITEQARAMGVRFDQLERKWKNAAPSAAYHAPLPGMSDEAKAARAALDPAYAARLQGENTPQSKQLPAGLTSPHHNPQTGEDIAWDGTKWVKY